MNFIWHDIFTPDIQASQQFYGSVFDLQFKTQQYKESKYLTFSNRDGSQGGLSEIPAETDLPAHWLGYLSISEIEIFTEKVNNNRGSIINATDNYVIFSSPGGALAKGIAASVESSTPQSSGSIVWNELLSINTKDASEFFSAIGNWDSVRIDMWPSGTYCLFQKKGLNLAGMQLINPKWIHKDTWLPYFLTESIMTSRKQIVQQGGELITDILHLPRFGQYCVALDNVGALFALVERQ